MVAEEEEPTDVSYHRRQSIAHYDVTADDSYTYGNNSTPPSPTNLSSFDSNSNSNTNTNFSSGSHVVGFGLSSSSNHTSSGDGIPTSSNDQESQTTASGQKKYGCKF